MNAIPPIEILRLSLSHADYARLANPMGSAEKRSPICGSRVAVDVNLGPDGRVSELGMRVNACKFGEASSVLMASNVIGRRPADLIETAKFLSAWMIGDGLPPDWPGIEKLSPDRLNAVRKAAVQLAFQAAAEAAEQAEAMAGWG